MIWKLHVAGLAAIAAADPFDELVARFGFRNVALVSLGLVYAGLCFARFIVWLVEGE